MSTPQDEAEPFDPTDTWTLEATVVNLSQCYAKPPELMSPPPELPVPQNNTDSDYSKRTHDSSVMDCLSEGAVALELVQRMQHDASPSFHHRKSAEGGHETRATSQIAVPASTRGKTPSPSFGALSPIAVHPSILQITKWNPNTCTECIEIPGLQTTSKHSHFKERAGAGRHGLAGAEVEAIGGKGRPLSTAQRQGASISYTYSPRRMASRLPPCPSLPPPLAHVLTARGVPSSLGLPHDSSAIFPPSPCIPLPTRALPRPTPETPPCPSFPAPIYRPSDGQSQREPTAKRLNKLFDAATTGADSG